MKRACKKCVPVPIEHGFYWATLIKYHDPRRMVVQIRKNGFGQTRVFAPWYSRSFGLEEFKDWHGPLKDPVALGKAS